MCHKTFCEIGMDTPKEACSRERGAPWRPPRPVRAKQRRTTNGGEGRVCVCELRQTSWPEGAQRCMRKACCGCVCASAGWINQLSLTCQQ
jgi:hypothetical protein